MNRASDKIMPLSGLAGTTRQGVKLVCSALFLVVACAAAWWSWGKALDAQITAQRTEENVARARRAVLQIQSLAPPTLQMDSGQAINKLVQNAIEAAQANERSLRSRTVRALGPIADTGIFKNQVHLEFADLTQEQAGKLMNSLEQTQFPIWVDSADLTAASNDRWDLAVELDWCQSASSAVASR
jgi:hypothetical protein